MLSKPSYLVEHFVDLPYFQMFCLLSLCRAYQYTLLQLRQVVCLSFKYSILFSVQ